jgi:phenylacetic acid degradation operon negative regulatory protein
MRMVDRVSAATAQLVSRYRRQRPLRGGSLLVTLFGDSIAPRGGAITLGSLIGLAAPFGLNERLVRTAMTRLANEGWLDSQRRGRLSEYRLSGEGRERFDAATRQIYSAPDALWQGSWTLVLLPATSRAIRETARRVLGWAGFGEPSPGVFVHPTLPLADARRMLQRSAPLRAAILLATGISPADSHRALATLGWDLATLAARYRRFIDAFSPVDAALAARPDAEPCAAFIIRTLLIHYYRRIHLRDPLLPSALLPAGWIGAEAYALCRSVYRRASAAAERHLSAEAVTFDGPLPPPGPGSADRFGGPDR